MNEPTGTDLIPLDPSSRVTAPTMPSGRVELWSACSIDGAWHFERLEIEGTPWEVTCTIAPGWTMLATTLAKARRYAHGQLHLDLAGLASRAFSDVERGRRYEIVSDTIDNRIRYYRPRCARSK